MKLPKSVIGHHLKRDCSALCGCLRRCLSRRRAQSRIGANGDVPLTQGTARLFSRGRHRSSLKEKLVFLFLHPCGYWEWIVPSWLQFSFRVLWYRAKHRPSPRGAAGVRSSGGVAPRARMSPAACGGVRTVPCSPLPPSAPAHRQTRNKTPTEKFCLFDLKASMLQYILTS